MGSRGLLQVHYKVHKAEDIPYEDEDSLRDWIYKVWVDKDNMLKAPSPFSLLGIPQREGRWQEYYGGGPFAGGEEGRPYQMSYRKLVAQHAFFLGSSALIARYLLWPPAAAAIALFA